MKHVFALALLAAGCASAPPDPAKEASGAAEAAPEREDEGTADAELERLAFLVGTWVGEAEGVPFYEEVRRASGGGFAYRTFAWCNGDTTETELTHLRRGPGGAVELKGDGVTWTATTVEDGRLVLENPDLPFSQRIVFSEAGDGWTAEMSTDGRVTRYAMARAKPVGEGRPRVPVPDGRYEGGAVLDGVEATAAIVVEGGEVFATTPGGAERVAVEGQCYDPPHLRFAVPNGGEGMTFSGVVAGDSVRGALRVERRRGTLRLARAR